MMTRSKRRKLEVDAVTKRRDVKSDTKRKRDTVATASSRVFRIGVLVDVVFSFLADKERATLVVNKLTHHRSTLPQSWATKRYFHSHMEDTHAIMHLIPKMPLKTVIIDEMYAPSEQKVSKKKIKISKYNLQHLLAGSKNTLINLEMGTDWVNPLLPSQIYSIPLWAPKLQYLTLGGFPSTFAAFTKLFDPSNLSNMSHGSTMPLQSLRRLKLEDFFSPHQAMTILKGLPKLEQVHLSPKITTDLPRAFDSQEMATICSLLSKMHLTSLSLENMKPHAPLFEGECSPLQSSLEVLLVDAKITTLLPGLLRCKNLTGLAAHFDPAFTPICVEQIVTNLTKLRSLMLHVGKSNSVAFAKLFDPSHDDIDAPRIAFPSLRYLSFNGRFMPEHLTPILKGLPKLEELHLSPKVTVDEGKRYSPWANANLCTLLSKMSLKSLSVNRLIFDPSLLNRDPSPLHASLKFLSIDAPLNSLLPGLLRCKELTDLGVGPDGKFAELHLEQIVSSLMKLEHIELAPFDTFDSTGHDKFLTMIASIPTLTHLHCSFGDSIDLKAIAKVGGFVDVEQDIQAHIFSNASNTSNASNKNLTLTTTECSYC